MALFLTKKEYFVQTAKIMNPSNIPNNAEDYDKSKYVFQEVPRANEKKRKKNKNKQMRKDMLEGFGY